jgi:organic radical activating enzyme
VIARSADSATFCALPWIHLSTSVDGVWSRCCFDTTNDYGELYAEPDEPVFALDEDAIGCVPRSRFAQDNPDRAFGLLEAFNAPAIRRTRREMLAGERPRACAFCWEREDAGVRSHRHAMNGRFGSVDFGELVAKTSEDGALDAAPVFLDLRFGNACNLRCVMCSHPISSRFATHTRPSWASAHIDPYSDDDALWDELARLAPELRFVYFAGGEPFLQSGHRRMLDLLVASGAAGRIELHYNSNLTLLPSWLFERLAPFDHVVLAASCDGVGEVFERIRVGARWERFATNVRRAKSHAELWLDVAVQQANIEHLDELLDFADAEGVRLRLENIVSDPEELSIRNLAEPAKARARDRLRALMDDARVGERPELAVDLRSVAAFLDLDPTEPT